MDPAHLERLARCLARPEITAHDPTSLAALAVALTEADPPVSAGRHGGLVAYAPGPHRRRLLELDRRDALVAMLSWRQDGSLRWAKCRIPQGRWIGIEPGGDIHPAWGRSDRVWLVEDSAPWKPIEPLTLFQALDYARLDFIPPLAEPRRLPTGAGAAVLNLLAGLMKDQGTARVRYVGPYPTEHLFTALLESFRYDPSVESPLERFLAGEPLDWLPAPHERHEVAEGVWVQMRQGIEKVILDGVTFYQTRWQEVERREPRVLRPDGNRLVASLWALARPLEDRLVLDSSGEVLDRPAPLADPRPPAPMPPVWRRALAALIARESPPVLGPAIDTVLGGLALEWGPVPGDLVEAGAGRLRVSRRLRDLGHEWIAGASGPERGDRAVAFVLEVAQLLAPVVKLRAQETLERLPEDEQRRRWETAEAEPPAPLDDSVGRLVLLVASGSG